MDPVVDLEHHDVLDMQISESIIALKQFIKLNENKLNQIHNFKEDDKIHDNELCEQIQLEIADLILDANSSKDWFFSKGLNKGIIK